MFKEMRNVKSSFVNSNISTVRDFANRFIWSGFEYYLRSEGDSYIVFSPVKYFKSLGIFKNPEQRFVKGFLFNRKYFHASVSSIGCILWTFEENSQPTSFNLGVYDIANNTIVDLGNMEIKKIRTTLSASNQKYVGKIIGAIACDSHGLPITGRKTETTIYVDDDVIAYFCPVSASYDMARLPYFNGRGTYVLKQNYLYVVPLFTAKMYSYDKWYEKDSIFITYDGGDAYTHDVNFLKSCLIYTCLSNQNKCLSFDGSDGRQYQNELCFDDSRTEKPLAFQDLERYAATKATALDEDEEKLIEVWKQVLAEARKTPEYNPEFNYGVYQIAKELNTSYTIGSGKTKKTVYDYPVLNGHLDTLRVMLKAYYKSHITEKMFEYELLK